ncbi:MULTISPECIES: hypothetical protein [unclassified Leptolyngbya]|uniref:hypothetical protein n=1 Tax=unclassified Leptolyngbya TaxID=2650499 RepID=UPI001688295B|nr:MULTISPECIES: hypothetical protein [unclassified Leptolyngbya]MBD1911847.1 hypothetical protein [Leptolyngbya sp. FACHB-8]MBD2157470.1 hypothetical protein [Leptolyngbya sp. FACHB-16]
MSYQEQLNPWVVHKLMPDFKQAAVARFRHRSDAEAYLKIVARMIPQARFAIAFDVQQKIQGATPSASEAVA